MVCPNCGRELPEGNIYCPECGKEVQVISAVDDLEDEILRGFVDEEQRSAREKESRSGTTEKSGRSDQTEKAGKNEHEEKAGKRKKRTRTLVIVLVIVAAAIAVFAVFRVRQNHSPDYLLGRAESEYVSGDYEDALAFLERLLALDGESDNEEALLLAGQVCSALGDYDEAEDYFLLVTALDPDCVEAYEGLMDLYYIQGRTDAIIALKNGVTNPVILALFDDYIVASPTISVEGGNFSDYFTVELDTDKKGLTIFYTLDGSVPDQTSFLYSSPIDIDEEGTIVLTAVCMDENGNYSEPVSETYTVELVPPDMPVASPDGGTFTEAVKVTVMAPEGTTVYYTWDNTTPDTNSAVYTSPIRIPEGNNVLSIIAVDENGMSSSVLKCNYIYYPKTTSETLSSPDTDTGSTYSGQGQEETSAVKASVGQSGSEISNDEPLAETADEP